MNMFNDMIKSLVAVVVLCLCSSAQADIRVLVRFDEQGYEVVNVKRGLLSDDDADVVNSATVPSLHEMVVRWIDVNGAVLEVNSLSDPRVVHVLLNGDQSGPTWGTLESSAYLLFGPDDAVSVEIILPMRDTPPLNGEYFTLILP